MNDFQSMFINIRLIGIQILAKIVFFFFFYFTFRYLVAFKILIMLPYSSIKGLISLTISCILSVL